MNDEVICASNQSGLEQRINGGKEFHMLIKMGWKGEGLGADGNGIRDSLCSEQLNYRSGLETGWQLSNMVMTWPRYKCAFPFYRRQSNAVTYNTIIGRLLKLTSEKRKMAELSEAENYAP